MEGGGADIHLWAEDAGVDEARLQIRSPFVRRCSWHWKADNRLGRFLHLGSYGGGGRPEAARPMVPTCGMSPHGLLAGAETQQTRGSRTGGEGKMEEEIDKGREGWNTHGPSGTVLDFKPCWERIEGQEVNPSPH